MSMLIGLGQGLSQMGQGIGQAMIAAQERRRLEEQQAFQNMIASGQLDLQRNEAARKAAMDEREHIFKLAGSMPQGQTTVDAATGEDWLRRAPDMGAFIKPQQELSSRGLLDGAESGVQRAPQPTGSYTVTRPESDAYARALLTQQGKDKDRETRRYAIEARIRAADATNRIRMEISRETNQTRREMLERQLGALMSRHADMMDVRGDLSDLAWQRANAEMLGDWQKLMANPLMLTDPNTPVPTVKRGGGKGRGAGGSTPPPVADPIDDILNEMGLGRPAPTKK